MDPLFVIAGTQVVGIVVLLHALIGDRRTGRGIARPAPQAPMAIWSWPRTRRMLAATVTGAFLAPLGSFVLAPPAHAGPPGSGSEPGGGGDEKVWTERKRWEVPDQYGGGHYEGTIAEFHWYLEEMARRPEGETPEASNEESDPSPDDESESQFAPGAPAPPDWSGGGGDFGDPDSDGFTSDDSPFDDAPDVPQSHASSGRDKPRGQYPSDDMPDDPDARARIQRDLENASTTEEKHDVVERARNGEYDDPPNDSTEGDSESGSAGAMEPFSEGTGDWDLGGGDFADYDGFQD